jgi:hypothetical protein
MPRFSTCTLVAGGNGAFEDDYIPTLSINQVTGISSSYGF